MKIAFLARIPCKSSSHSYFMMWKTPFISYNNHPFNYDPGHIFPHFSFAWGNWLGENCQSKYHSPASNLDTCFLSSIITSIGEHTKHLLKHKAVKVCLCVSSVQTPECGHDGHVMTPPMAPPSPAPGHSLVSHKHQVTSEKMPLLLLKLLFVVDIKGVFCAKIFCASQCFLSVEHYSMCRLF